MSEIAKCAKAVKMKLEGYNIEAIAIALGVTEEIAFGYTQGKIPIKTRKIKGGTIPAGTVIHLPKSSQTVDFKSEKINREVENK